MDKIEALSGLTQSGFTGKVGFNPSAFKKERIDAIRAIIREHLRPIKNISPYYAGRSYTLKHKIEEYASRINNPILGNYITNGECIYAMYLEGYKVKHDPEGKNALFNVSKKSFDEFLELIENQTKKSDTRLSGMYKMPGQAGHDN